MKKKLAVIILNWNGRKLLERFIPDAAANTIGEEADLFVADNGSTDDSLEWLRANHPGVKVIPFPENYGFAEGYNRALEATRYPYTVLLNSDVRVPAGWWQPLLHFMEENPDVAACQDTQRASAGDVRVCRRRRRIPGPLRLPLLPRAPLRPRGARRGAI